LPEHITRKRRPDAEREGREGKGNTKVTIESGRKRVEKRCEREGVFGLWERELVESLDSK